MRMLDGYIVLSFAAGFLSPAKRRDIVSYSFTFIIPRASGILFSVCLSVCLSDRTLFAAFCAVNSS